MDTYTTKTAPRGTPHFNPTGSVRLHIAGGEMLLNGAFEQWLPVVMDGPKDGESTVQLLVDVTSLPSPRNKEELFSFTADRVRRLGPYAYGAEGVLRLSGVERPQEAIIQTPEAHTPFCLLTFTFNRSDYQLLFDAFEGRAAAQSLRGDSEVRARAWLRAPDVAAG